MSLMPLRVNFPTLAKTLEVEESGQIVRFRKWQESALQLSQLSTEFTPELQTLYQGLLSDGIAQLFEVDLPGLNQVLEAREKDVSALKESLASTNLSLINLQKGHEFWKEVLAQTRDIYLGELSKVLTDVYQTVYQDDSKAVILTSKESRGKQVVEIRFEVKIGDVTYFEDFGSQAGSIKGVLGFVFSIYYIILTGLPRFLACDEMFASLDRNVLQRLLLILRKFKEEMGFCFLVIDHAIQRFDVDLIDRAYTIDKSGVYHEVPASGWTALFEAGGQEDVE